MPTPVKAGAAVGGGGALVAIGLFLGSGKGLVFLLVLLALLVVVLGGYLLWTSWARKKRSAQLGGDLQQHTSASPRGISDPGQRARLDDLRKKFETGVHEYRSRGKDLYTLPWYVIVGEPGSGKTEAVRHSNVGFPPGMQDEFQGVGGTINMNWWFTNQAVLLDTAGRLMFEEVKPGETNEWREFLNLLKKHRPNCPVNGLLLVIPSDSLIKDTADQIAKKAGKIAQQLDVIQRVLDVRFPVYVAVTKCDKINGFREFFDGLTDPQLQHQIMGWSNPDPLDAPFRPELVDQHLEKVVERLRRRRLGLLRDPIAEDPSARRADEVDALYALPHSLSLLAPRLRRYLETIFIAGEWSAKPLFLRGIYFTSSMREGAALDEELARVIGVAVEDLPEGKVWERERSYFLRDLFLEKAFRERGLVTRATNTRRMLRRQQLGLLGVAAVGLVLFGAIAWFSMRTLRGDVEGLSKYWETVGSSGWTNRIWQQSLIPRLPDGSLADYVTNQVWIGGKAENLGAFHKRLRDYAEQRLPRNWLTGGLADKYEKNSVRAQEIVFESGVVKPLLDAARQKMSQPSTAEAGARARLTEALGYLIRLEADILSPKRGPITSPAAEEFFRTLLGFVAGQEPQPDAGFTNLVQTMARTYSKETVWPPAWCSRATNQPNALTNHPALRAGLESLLRSGTNYAEAQMDEWRKTGPLLAALGQFNAAEQALAQAAREGNDPKFDQQYQALGQAKAAVDAQMAQVVGLPLFRGGFGLARGFQALSNSIVDNLTNALGPVKAANDEALTVQTNRLFLDIRESLENMRTALQSRAKGIRALGDVEQLRQFDEHCLANAAYSNRWSFYQGPVGLMAVRPFTNAAVALLGVAAKPLDDFFAGKMDPLRLQAVQYTGPGRAELTNIVTYALDRVGRVQRLGFMQAYLQRANGRLRAQAGFPIVKALDKPMDVARLQSLLLTEFVPVVRELSAPVFKASPFAESDAWKDFTNWVNLAYRNATMVLDDNGNLRECIVSYRGSEDPDEIKAGEWRFSYYFIHLKSSEKASVRTTTDSELGRVRLDQPLTLQFQENFNSPVAHEVESGKWGALSLLHQYNARPDAKRTTWLVDWPVELTKGGERVTGKVRLKLEFKEPVTNPGDWPPP